MSPPITLDPRNLPEYALRTTLRMFAAIVASLIFTFVVATLAAKSRKAELVIIPALDILQSVPVLGFLTFTVTFFLGLFPGNVLGAECAAIFAIFTAQAWNMAFSFYQSLRTIPSDLDECARHFRLSPWLRFWRLEVPFAAPGLIWNTMMSMSGGWFFVVASEAITVGDTTVTLPGIGSWIAIAIARENLGAVALAVGTMAIVILAYDQFVFRPIIAWADKFKFEQTAAQERPHSWVYDLMRRTKVLRRLMAPLARLGDHVSTVRLPLPKRPRKTLPPWFDRATNLVWLGVVLAVTAYALWVIVEYVHSTLGLHEILTAIGLGLLTLLRVVILIALASVVWVPIGVWIGLRPWAAERVQPIAQFLAAFPANVLFPIAVVAIVQLALEPEYLAEPADGARHPVVHPLQRHRRRQCVPDRSTRGRNPLPFAFAAVVAQGDRAWHPALLRDRRADRDRRIVECKHRRGSGELGTDQASSSGDWGLYRRGNRCGRLSPGRARDSSDVDVRDRHEPDSVAAALPDCRGALPVELRRVSRAIEADNHSWLERSRMDAPVAKRTSVLADAPLVKVDGVSRTYHKGGGNDLLVLQDVSLELRANEIVSLLGRSGSGKSTLLRIIAGLMPPTRGTVAIDGETVDGPARADRHGVSELRSVPVADRAAERGNRA